MSGEKRKKNKICEEPGLLRCAIKNDAEVGFPGINYLKRRKKKVV